MNVALRIEAVHDPVDAQAVLDDWLRALEGAPAAVLSEAGLGRLKVPAAVEAVELGLGCPCCTGAVVLWVTLVRVLHRLRPTHVLLLLARAEHVARLQEQVRCGELGVGLRLI